MEPIGLYFSIDQVEAARQHHQQDEVLARAWHWLQAEPGAVIYERKPYQRGADPEPVTKPTLDAAAAAVEAAFRYRFLNDLAAGESAAAQIRAGFGLRSEATQLDTLMTLLPVMQTVALVHPLLGDSATRWLADFREMLQTLLQAEAQATFVEQAWLVPLRIAGGVLLRDDSLTAAGAAAFRQIIDTQIHPEGYLKGAVDGRDGQSFLRQMLAVGALTLAAEAATQSGVDLWSYQNRDVSLNTAATYLVYYYFYPAKWRWDDHLTEADTRSLFGQIGAFMEIAAAHQMPRGAEMLLDEERPLFSAALGGLTTLSHYRPPQRKRGWFGR